MSDHLRSGSGQQSVLSTLIRDAETLDLKIWNLCYPRHYQVGNIYPSPKQLAAELAFIYNAYVCRMHTMPRDLALLSQAMCGVSGLVWLQVPIFFVAPDLFRAVQLSILPVDLDWANLHLPFDSAALTLPRGSLSHARYGEIGYIWYSRIHKGKPFPSLAEAKCEGIAQDDYLLIRGTCMEWREAPSFQRFIQRSETPTLNLKDFGAVVGSPVPPCFSAYGAITSHATVELQVC